MTKMCNPEDSRPSYFSIRSIETLQNIHEFPSIVVISSIKHTAQIFSENLTNEYCLAKQTARVGGEGKRQFYVKRLLLGSL